MSTPLPKLNAPIERVDLEDAARSGELLATEQDPDAIERAAEHHGLAFARVDLSRATTKRELLRAIAAALSFPAHFGENWDALYDCLTDLDLARGLVLLLDGAGPFAAKAPADFTDACAVLRAAADDWKEDDVAFWVLVRGLA